MSLFPSNHPDPTQVSNVTTSVPPEPSSAITTGDMPSSVAAATHSNGRHIVIAFDGSEYSKRAVFWTVDNLYREGDYLHLAHAQETRSSIFERRPSRDQQAMFEKQATQLMELMVKILLERRVNLGKKIICTTGKQGIVEIIKENDYDIVVVGSRGLGAVKRAVMGSFSTFIVRNCECPVVVVRTKGERDISPVFDRTT